VILLLYVDNLVLAAPGSDRIDWIRARLQKEFDMTDLGDLKSFLRLQIFRNRQKRTLHLSQRRYIQKILESHGMSNCNPAATPADPHIRLEKSSEDFEATGIDRQR